MIEKILYGLYRARYRFARSLPLRSPVDVSLELASVCNQRCGYCYHANQTNLPFTKGLMDFYTAKLIIESAAAAGASSIKFNWKGESTLNPRFEEVTSIAKRLARGGVFIDRLTNSNFKFATTRDDIFRGLCNQTKVKVSFDSFDADVMETQREGSIHAIAMKNIDVFYNHKFRRKTEIVIQAVRTQRNRDEDILGMAKRRWPEAGVSIRDMVTGRIESDLSALSTRARDMENRQSCIQAHARLIFNWKGEAFPCCPDIGEKLKLGTIYEHSVKEIFNGIEARKLRESLKSGEAFKKDPCLSCPSFESYKGYSPGWTS